MLVLAAHIIISTARLCGPSGRVCVPKATAFWPCSSVGTHGVGSGVHRPWSSVGAHGAGSGN